jgi:hypothetical protein
MLVALLIVGLVDWHDGGTFLRTGGGGYGQLVVIGQQYSYGIQLETASGPSVRLDGVSASYPKALQVRWSVYRGEGGFAGWLGSLRPRWPTAAVHGYRVAQPAGHPERGGTLLVGTVRATEAGVYHLSQITIRYRSGMRTRRVSAGTDVCLLAVQPADVARVSRQIAAFVPDVTGSESADRLVVKYEECSKEALTR